MNRKDNYYLRNLELDTEEGYSFIDGCRNSVKKEKLSDFEPDSLHEKLQAGKESAAKQEATHKQNNELIVGGN